MAAVAMVSQQDLELVRQIRRLRINAHHAVLSQSTSQLRADVDAERRRLSDVFARFQEWVKLHGKLVRAAELIGIQVPAWLGIAGAYGVMVSTFEEITMPSWAENAFGIMMVGSMLVAFLPGASAVFTSWLLNRRGDALREAFADYRHPLDSGQEPDSDIAGLEGQLGSGLAVLINRTDHVGELIYSCCPLRDMLGKRTAENATSWDRVCAEVLADVDKDGRLGPWTKASLARHAQESLVPFEDVTRAIRLLEVPYEQIGVFERGLAVHV